MIRTYKFLMRPTVGQAQLLTEMLRDHCSLYNAALQERRDAYRHPSKTSVSFFTQAAQLKDIRAYDERHGRWSSKSQLQTLRRLDKAFAAFFRRVKAGQTPGYPRFRGVNWFDTVDFINGDGAKWDSVPGDKVSRVRFQGIGHVRVHQHRAIKGRVKTVSVKREGRRWFVTVVCDQIPAEPLPPTGAVTGIDMGIASFLTTSEGEHIANPRHGRRNADALAEAQRALAKFPRAKRVDRSANHRRAVEKVARLNGKVARQRLDHAHKTALNLVRDYDVIVHENLRIANMVRRAAPRPDPDMLGAYLPNGGSAKTGLNRSISDAGWGMFLLIVTAKAESAGRTLIAVNPANTSRTCPQCGHVSAENRKTQAAFVCVSCGHSAHADVVGALNVLRAGLALQAAQAV